MVGSESEGPASGRPPTSTLITPRVSKDRTVNFSTPAPVGQTIRGLIDDAKRQGQAVLPSSYKTPVTFSRPFGYASSISGRGTSSHGLLSSVPGKGRPILGSNNTPTRVGGETWNASAPCTAKKSLSATPISQRLSSVRASLKDDANTPNNRTTGPAITQSLKPNAVFATPQTPTRKRTPSKQRPAATQINSANREAVIAQTKERIRTFRFFFDCSDPRVTAEAAKQVKEVGGRVELFLNKSITHLVTTQPLPLDVGTSKAQPKTPTKSPGGRFLEKKTTRGKGVDDKISIAKKFGAQLWTLQRFQSIMKAIQGEEAPRKLRDHLRDERIYGISTTRNIEGKASFHPFVGRYLLVEDTSDLYRPIHVKEYKEPKDPCDPPWPVIQFKDRQGRCAFLHYSDTDGPAVEESDDAASPSKAGLLIDRVPVVLENFDKSSDDEGQENALPAQTYHGVSAASGLVSMSAALPQRMAAAKTATVKRLGERQLTVKPKKEGITKPKKTPEQPRRDDGVPGKAFYTRPGYCENCNVKYDVYTEHVGSTVHKTWLSQASFLELDNLLGKLSRPPRVESAIDSAQNAGVTVSDNFGQETGSGCSQKDEAVLLSPGSTEDPSPQPQPDENPFLEPEISKTCTIPLVRRRSLSKEVRALAPLHPPAAKDKPENQSAQMAREQTERADLAPSPITKARRRSIAGSTPFHRKQLHLFYDPNTTSPVPSVAQTPGQSSEQDNQPAGIKRSGEVIERKVKKIRLILGPPPKGYCSPHRNPGRAHQIEFGTPRLSELSSAPGYPVDVPQDKPKAPEVGRHSKPPTDDASPTTTIKDHAIELPSPSEESSSTTLPTIGVSVAQRLESPPESCIAKQPEAVATCLDRHASVPITPADTIISGPVARQHQPHVSSDFLRTVLNEEDMMPGSWGTPLYRSLSRAWPMLIESGSIVKEADAAIKEHAYEEPEKKRVTPGSKVEGNLVVNAMDDPVTPENHTEAAQGSEEGTGNSLSIAPDELDLPDTPMRHSTRETPRKRRNSTVARPTIVSETSLSDPILETPRKRRYVPRSSFTTQRVRTRTADAPQLVNAMRATPERRGPRSLPGDGSSGSESADTIAIGYVTEVTDLFGAPLPHLATTPKGSPVFARAPTSPFTPRSIRPFSPLLGRRNGVAAPALVRSISRRLLGTAKSPLPPPPPLAGQPTASPGWTTMKPKLTVDPAWYSELCHAIASEPVSSDVEASPLRRPPEPPMSSSPLSSVNSEDLELERRIAAAAAAAAAVIPAESPSARALSRKRSAGQLDDSGKAAAG
ncbi:hypothetical protein HKX48_006169 [Thoreauomyces humboldtii]|nr:hypothetical protein HKX48_006169 [Thoreauomyces humboldtii]